LAFDEAYVTLRIVFIRNIINFVAHDLNYLKHLLLPT